MEEVTLGEKNKIKIKKIAKKLRSYHSYQFIKLHSKKSLLNLQMEDLVYTS